MIGRKDRKGLKIFDEIVEYCKNLHSEQKPKDLSCGQWITVISKDKFLAQGTIACKIAHRYPEVFNVFSCGENTKIPYVIFSFKQGKNSV